MRSRAQQTSLTSPAYVAIAYAAVTILYTWPLILRLPEVLPHDIGDPILSTWTLWWNSRVLPFTSNWWDAPIFAPAHNTITLSDHRVGISVFSTPLLLFGLQPVTVYNVVFLFTFLLNACAAHALAFTITRRNDASFLAGLIFGFNPFRAAHLEHLELLASYWVPVIFICAHCWLDRRHSRALILLSITLVMHLLTSSYLFAFAGVLIGMWLLWFIGRPSLRQCALLALSIATPLIVALPIFLKYSSAHDEMGLARDIGEIQQFSADVSDLGRRPVQLAILPGPPLPTQETAVMPELVALLLLVAGWFADRSSCGSSPQPRLLTLLRRMFVVCSICALIVSVIPHAFGAQLFHFGAITVSISRPSKAAAIAAAAAIAWLLTAPTVVRAWSCRSALHFYGLATAALFLFALGPTVFFHGQRVLYKGPYALLMYLPAFRDELRVPARFAMLAALTLALAAGIAFARLLEGRKAHSRQLALLAAAMAILCDSWVYPFPLVPIPAPLELPRSLPQHAAVLELPFGVFEDATAMFHQMSHERPLVNGTSGYRPPHYAVLTALFAEERYRGLNALAEFRDIAIFIKRDARGDLMREKLMGQLAVESLEPTATHHVLLLPRRQGSGTTLDERNTIDIVKVTADPHANAAALVADRKADTYWSTVTGQSGREVVCLELAAMARVTGVSMDISPYVDNFPRELALEVSPNGQEWSRVWSGDVSQHAVTAALTNPRALSIGISVETSDVRHVCARQLAVSDTAWSIAEMRVFINEP